ncbi:EAL and HDOD domain-containing protein [Cellulomonas fimi]|uniref:HDOD domain-containing protein n=1 Tax=Cellulomonas fimi TaxID=1708 RepID=A0A7Y0LZG2_CELFI|nr:HDOD domain-containing protein [Cellulomonas fimi]NMR21023.1 HDOD domain-containing protein [Cellulomonas fimi]
MTSPGTRPADSAALTGVDVTVHRQPLIRRDGSVHGYAVGVVVRTSLAHAHLTERLDALVEAQYERLDLEAVGGGSPVFVQATQGMLLRDEPIAGNRDLIVLEVPRHFADLPGAGAHLSRLRAAGYGLALNDYVPGGGQDPLLPIVHFVKVDLGRGQELATTAIRAAQAAARATIAMRVDTDARVGYCTSAGVDLQQGPMFQRDAPTVEREYTTGELQCLELMQLLSAPAPDQEAVVRVVGSDPELAMRVLRLVNSSAVPVRHEVDSVRQAVVLLGPRQLGALATSALAGAERATIASLWSVLTRAIACATLAGDDAGYTVGLLSAAAAQLRVPASDLVARTGVSDEVGSALCDLSGPYGPVLAAVLAHEENDVAAVEATGLVPFEVAHAYLAAVSEALGTATLLAGPARR